ncbi:MAG TPA: 8-amino-7-oxononanoate synthase [Myxococcales bacterium]|nr:8-amino-7-oxononanoate synthase [Myxococcales bacterium]
MTDALAAYRLDISEGLQRTERQHLLRRLLPGTGVDFTSNDYLGLARDRDFAAQVADRLSAYPTGATASRLLRGHHRWHADTEACLALWCGAPAALLFSSGYALNAGLYAALVGAGDLLLSDQLNHASIIDGMRLSRAETSIFAHQDLDELERRLSQRPAGQRALVVTEALFSMDGDLTDLGAMVDICERQGALLVVDEAHSTGIWPGGRVACLGLRDRVLGTVHTGGKALGGQGAWFAADQWLIDHLVNHCRSFVFSTGVSAAQCVVMQSAVDWVDTQPWRRQALERNIAHFLRRADELSLPLSLGAASAIMPVVVGDDDRALRVAAQIQAHGYDVRAVRPPTVAPGTSRLRITLHATHTKAHIEGLVSALDKALTQEE